MRRRYATLLALSIAACSSPTPFVPGSDAGPSGDDAGTPPSDAAAHDDASFAPDAFVPGDAATVDAATADAATADAATADAATADAAVTDAATVDAATLGDAGPAFEQRGVLQVWLESTGTLTPIALLSDGADWLLVASVDEWLPTSGSVSDAVVARLDGNYEIRWARRYALGAFFRPARARRDGDAVLVIGTIETGADSRGAVLEVAASDGSVRWASIVGDGREQLSDVLPLAGGAIALLGTSGEYALEVGVAERAFVTVLDASGEAAWSRSVYRTLAGGRGTVLASGPGTDLTLATEGVSGGLEVELLTIAATGAARRGWRVTGVVGTPVALESTAAGLALVATSTITSGVSYARTTSYTELDAVSGTVVRGWASDGTTFGAAVGADEILFAQQTNPSEAVVARLGADGTPRAGRVLDPAVPSGSGDGFRSVALDATAIRGVARIADDAWLVRSPLADADACVLARWTTSPVASTPSVTAITARSVTISPSVTHPAVSASDLELVRTDECPP